MLMIWPKTSKEKKIAVIADCSYWNDNSASLRLSRELQAVR